jgi:predicted nucleotidyltransferase
LKNNKLSGNYSATPTEVNIMNKAEIEYSDLIKRQNIKSLIAEYKLEIEKNYKIHSLVLFGSRARGDNRVDSDIDLAVVIPDLSDNNDERTDLSLKLLDLGWDIEIKSGLKINPFPISLNELMHSSDLGTKEIIKNIAIEGVELK